MNSQQLYINIHQVLSEDISNPHPTQQDFDRRLSLHIARNSGDNISHITLEFVGIRAKFFSCITFDGTGDYGCGLNSFAMPKLKIGVTQKALVLLSILEYLIDQGKLCGDIEFFKEKISAEMNGGVNALLPRYDRLNKTSLAILASRVVNTADAAA